MSNYTYRDTPATDEPYSLPERRYVINPPQPEPAAPGEPACWGCGCAVKTEGEMCFRCYMREHADW